MSVWRRRARELFPERVADRGAQRSATTFFAAHGEDLRAVYAGERTEPDLEARAFAFAEWSLQPRQAATLRRAVIDGLLLHLPNVDAGRRALATRLRPDLFADLEPRYQSALPAAHLLALKQAVASACAGDPKAAASPGLLLTRRPGYCDDARLWCGRRAAEPCLVRPHFHMSDMSPHLGSDDLRWRLGGVSAEFVEIVVQSRATADDFWDGNWLACRVDVHAGGCRVRCNASLRAEELVDFRDALTALSAGAVSDAAFTTVEEQLELRLRCHGTGQMQLTGMVQDRAGDGNSLRFTLELDQSYLPESLSELDRLVARFPVRGTRAG